jgi:tetratricopeptide (TPR) repeat protein
MPRPNAKAALSAIPLLLLALAIAPSRAQDLTVSLPQHAKDGKTEAELDDESKKAFELYDHGQTLAALPLFEDLHAHRPKNPAYMEGLAMSYIARGGASATPGQDVADSKLALQLFLDAKSAGATDDLCQIMIEKLSASATQPASTTPSGPKPPFREDFGQAEVLFNKGDLAGAVPLYAKSYGENPTFYFAPLYAGDCEFKLGHYDEAGVWFARAIAIDPDTETAHRYWADDLLKAGKVSEAHKQYVEAFIVDPYSKAPRLQLRAFAAKNGFRVIPPPITLPAPPTTGKDGHINITMAFPAAGERQDPLSFVWLGYSMNAALWQGEKFKKTYPNEKQYRHSLAEEVDSLKMVTALVRERKVPEAQQSPTIRSLMALDKDNMLECWILLDNPDQGTAQDFVAYRAAHRDLLRAYVEKYDLHPE